MQSGRAPVGHERASHHLRKNILRLFLPVTFLFEKRKRETKILSGFIGSSFRVALERPYSGTMSANDPYQSIARFYEAVMGEREDVQYVEALLKRHHPNARTLLELGCGTGTMLASLSRKYEAVGLDISTAMLELARRRMLHVELIEGDMRDFQLGRKFDIVMCVFDSLNHVTSFSDWERVFRRAAEHLEPGGIFLFDINTEYKFQAYVRDAPIVEQLGRDVCIYEVSPLSHGRYALDIQIFEWKEGKTFELQRGVVIEKTFPARRIAAALRKHFRSYRTYDEEFGRVTRTTQTIYYVCKK